MNPANTAAPARTPHRTSTCARARRASRAWTASAWTTRARRSRARTARARWRRRPPASRARASAAGRARAATRTPTTAPARPAATAPCAATASTPSSANVRLAGRGPRAPTVSSFILVQRFWRAKLIWLQKRSGFFGLDPSPCGVYSHLWAAPLQNQLRSFNSEICIVDDPKLTNGVEPLGERRGVGLLAVE